MEGLASYLLTVVLLPALLAPATAWIVAMSPWRRRPDALGTALAAAVGATLCMAFVREVDLATAARAVLGGADPSQPVVRWHSLGAAGAAIALGAPVAGWVQRAAGPRRLAVTAAAVAATVAVAASLRFPGTDMATRITVGAGMLASIAILRGLTMPLALASGAVALLVLGGASVAGSFPSLGAIAVATGLGCAGTACTMLLPAMREARAADAGTALAIALAAAVAVVAWCGGAYADGAMPWWCFTAVAVAAPAAAAGARAAWPGRGPRG